MLAEGPFLIPSGRVEQEHRVRGSRFISVAVYADSTREAARARDRSRKRFHDATHHVYGFVPAEGAPSGDDDGEPAGTGWRPIVMAIEGRGLRNAAVVVVRYFGGTKLGTGGLARAYRAAAAAALASLPTKSVQRGRCVRLTYPYESTGAVARFLDRCGATRLSEEHGEHPILVVGVPDSRVEEFRRGVADVTGGRAEVEDAGGTILLPAST